MVKTHTLHNFSTEKNALINILSRKITATKFTSVNMTFDNKYAVAFDPINSLLNAIEAKFRKCEMIYVGYFENIDHDILSGNTSSLPFEMECTYIELGNMVKHFYSIDDKSSYKEAIDQNFQTFILTLASLYENLVLLAEIFIKKVMVYVNKSLSSPLHDYLEYLKRLVALGYRKNDQLNICMTSFNAFFSKYLIQINKLRNSFIHGYKLNLQSDGFHYFVDDLDKGSFTHNSPELLVDQFTKHVLDNTRNFISQLLSALKESTKHYSRSIPA